MAPSEDPFSKKTSKQNGSLKNKKELSSRGKVAAGDSYMNDGPSSQEEKYWARNAHSASYNDEDDPHLHGENKDDNQQIKSRQPSRRTTRIRNGANTNSDISSSSSIRTIPELRDAKTGVLLFQQANVILDGEEDINIEDASQVQSGEMMRISPSTSNNNNNNNMPTGQYQLYPGYAPANPNDLNNGQNNYNNNHPLPNNPGGSLSQPHNTNGMAPIPHYPFLQYPQPGSAYPRNYFDPHGQYVATSNSTSDNGLPMVRGEEVGIVLVVLLLWVGAIILFFNRWGKIRMLEPYQPKFCENHRPSCPMAEVTAISNHPVCRERTFSKFNLSTEMLAGPNGSPHFVKCNYHGVPSTDPVAGFSGLASTSGIAPGGLTIPGAGFPSGGSTGMLNSHRNSIMMMNHHHSRPRQNSVFVTSPSSQVNFYGSDTTLKSSARKTKSAVDLPTLVLTGEFIDNVRRNSKNSITQL